MIFIFICLVSCLGSTVLGHNVIHIKYFRQPVEFGSFKFSLNDGAEEWETFIYMNKSMHLREEDIYDAVKPFFESKPETHPRYESSSITRHLGKQFEYILNKYTIDELIFENLCSQMKPKFSKLLSATSQKPNKIKWVVEHPSSPFVIPDGFRKDIGREEYRLEILGRVLFNQENLEFEALRNTRKLIVHQHKEYKNGLSGEQIIKINSPEVLIEGQNHMGTKELKQFAKEWVNGEREVKKWEIHLEDTSQNDKFFFEKGDTTLDVSIQNSRFFAFTYKTPQNPPYEFNTI